MSNQPLNFESLKDEERGLLSETDFLILTKFELAFCSSPESNVAEKAIRFVADLVVSTPDVDTESFVTSTWQVLIHIATQIPFTHQGQEALVQVVAMLDTCASPWNGLPGLGFSIRDSWNHSMSCDAHRPTEIYLGQDN